MIKPEPDRRETTTTKTVRLALDYARAHGIKHIVIASTTGATALKLAQMAKKQFNIVCITHQVGFAQPGKCELSRTVEKKLTEYQIPILRTTHLFAGVERAIRLKFGGIGPAEIIANTYRTFGEGTKVAVEIAVMALDAGLIPYGEDLISIAGTGKGADTALVLQPEHSHRFFMTKIKTIICKPTEF